MTRRICPALLASLVALGACSNTTGGELISTPFLVGGCDVCTSANVPRAEASQPFTFVNDTGWTVTLTQAWVDLGPFYFNVYPPNTTSFMSGTIIVEASSQVVIDALDPTLYQVQGGASGETGVSVAAQIGLLSPDVTVPIGLSTLINGDQNGGVGYVAGTATSGGTTVAFQGPILMSQELASPAMPLPYWQRVPGAGVNLDFMPAPQTLVMRVDPTHWFDEISFTSTELDTPPAPDAGTLATDDPCATNNGGCNVNATCNDTDTGVECTCNSGYAGDGGTCGLSANGWNVGSTINQELAQGLETASGTYLFTLVDGGVPTGTQMLYSSIPDGGT